MTAVESLFTQPFMQALGWALIHFVWQGALVAVLASILMAMLGQSANARYRVACGAMLLMLALPIATLCIVKTSLASHGVDYAVGRVSDMNSSASDTLVVNALGSSPAPQIWSQEFYGRLKPLLAWLISGWLIGVLALSIRLLGGWRYSQYIKKRATDSIMERWQETVTRLSQQLQITRPIRVLKSALVQVPTVIGWMRPVILLPASALTGLTPQQLEAILAHELAHIRRHDYLVNLLQTTIETLLFYHPAVWWVTRRIRIERENCCDDVAVAVCGNALTYARALMELEQLRGAAPQLAMAANGGVLFNRIRRLVQEPSSRSNPLGRWLAAVIVIGSVVAAGASSGNATNVSPIGTDQSKPATPQYSVSEQASAPSAALPVGADPQHLLVSEQENVKGEAALLEPIAAPPEILQPVNTSLSFQSEEEKARVQSADAMKKLLAELEGTDWQLTSEVRSALEQINRSGTVEPLIEALKNSDREVRGKAAWIIGQLGSRKAVPALIDAWKNETGEARHKMSWALGMIGDSRAVDPLLVALKASSRQERQDAAWALGQIGDPRTVDPLIEVLTNDSSFEVRHTTVWALGQIGDGKALPALKAALNDSSEFVRKQASIAIEMIGKR